MCLHSVGFQVSVTLCAVAHRPPQSFRQRILFIALMLVVSGATMLITCLNYFLLYCEISSRQLFISHSQLKEYAKGE